MAQQDSDTTQRHGSEPTLGDIAPSIAEMDDLPLLASYWLPTDIAPLRVRTLNALKTNLPGRNGGSPTVADLVPVEIGEVRKWRHAGEKTVNDVMRFVVAIHAHRRGGGSFDPASEVAVAEKVSSDPQSSVTEVLDAALGLMNPIAKVVVERRLLIPNPPSLGELAVPFGVSGERVRRVEKSICDGEFIRGALSERALGEAWALRQSLGGLVLLNSALLASELSERIGADDGRYRDDHARLLLALAGYRVVPPFHFPKMKIDDPWAAQGVSLSDVAEALENVTDAYGVLGDPTSVLVSFGINPAFCGDLLLTLGYGVVLNGWVSPKEYRGIAGASVAALAINGSPMTIAELTEATGREGGKNFASFLNTREEVVRVGKGTYGLREWGVEEYDGIASAITKCILANGGSASEKEIIADLTERFGVTAASVRSLCCTPKFFHEKGKVRLRLRSDPPPRERSVPPVGVFPHRDADGDYDVVTVLVDVDHDLLRGSGIGISHAVARVLHVEAGGDRVFSGSLQDVRLRSIATSVSSQFSTLRKTAKELDAREGDVFSLRMNPVDETYEVVVVRRDALAGGPSLEVACDLTGISVEDAPTLHRTLARFLDVPPEGLVNVLRKRKDTHLLSVLPSAS